MADSTHRGTRIEFREITKVFKQKKARVKALDNVSMTIEPGEIVGIIGYSGAGKSTLVRMINGLDTPSAGELLLDETNIVGMSEKKLRGIRRNIGMIFQQFNLMNSRTAAGNIEYPLQLQGVSKQERAQRVQELLDFVGLGDKGKSYPEQLSGGQKQRVGIARALATNPSLLLADEATSALDPTTTQEVLDLLRRVNKECCCNVVIPPWTTAMDTPASLSRAAAVKKPDSSVRLMVNRRPSCASRSSVSTTSGSLRSEVATNLAATEVCGLEKTS